MKKYLLLLFFAAYTCQAFCQTVNLNDLKALTVGNDYDKILVSKSFTALRTKHPSASGVTYVINNKSQRMEIISIGPSVAAKNGTFLHNISYMVRDTDYVQRIMKQVNMAGMVLTEKKTLKTQTNYRFDTKRLNIDISIKKHNAAQSSVTLQRRD